MLIKTHVNKTSQVFERSYRVNAVSTDLNNTSTSCPQAHLVGEQAGEAVDGEPRAHGLLLRMHHVRLAIHLRTRQMLLISFIPRFLSSVIVCRETSLLGSSQNIPSLAHQGPARNAT